MVHNSYSQPINVLLWRRRLRVHEQLLHGLDLTSEASVLAMPASTLRPDAEPAIAPSLADDAFIVVDVRDTPDGGDARLVERDLALRRHPHDTAVVHFTDQQRRLAGRTRHQTALAGVELDAVDERADRQ